MTPIFCYNWCGLLGNFDSDLKVVGDNFEIHKEDQHYGVWLKAYPLKKCPFFYIKKTTLRLGLAISLPNKEEMVREAYLW